MAIELATGYVNLVPSAQGIAEGIAKELGVPVSKAAQEAGANAGKKISDGLLGGVGDTGKQLLEKLGLLAVGAFAIKSAIDVEDANNIIVRSTGATGAALSGLEGSFRNVASTTSASFDVVASTLSQLYQRTGLQGKALESLTSQVVTFNRISKDSPITVQALTSALAGFNVPGAQMGTILDHLFVISQKTGVPLSDLLGILQTAGPIARQFGFSIDFTAGFLAQLNRAGVDASTIMPGLRSAFVQFAKAGREPAQALQETIAQIQGFIRTGDLASARNIAVQLFGARGTGLVDAAISGKINLDSLNQTVAATGDGILATGAKTGTLSGALGILRNNAKLALAQFATPALDAANQALRSILPTVRSLGDDFATLPDPIKVSAVALVGLTQLVGPLSNLGQAADTVGRVGRSIGTGFELAAVRGLELIDAIKAITLAQAGMALAAVGVIAIPVAIGFAVNALLDSASKAQHVTEALEKGRTAGKDWAEVIIAGARATEVPLDALKQRLWFLQASQANLVTQYKQGKLSTEEAAAAHGKYGTAIDSVQSAISRMKTEQAAARAEAEATKASLSGYASTVLVGGDATQAFSQLTADAKKALVDFQATLLAAAGGEVGYQQALINISKAEDDLAQALKDHPGDLALIHEKEVAVTAARLAGVQAVESRTKAEQDLVDKIHGDASFYDTELARLEKERDTYPELAGAIQLEIDKLNAAKDSADKLPASVSTKYTVDASDAFATLDALVPKLQAIGLSPGAVDLLTFKSLRAPATAAGGLFDTPQFRMFAEAGPEAVLPLNDPARSWQLIADAGLLGSAGKASQPASGASGGGLRIENAHFGDEGVLADLDYFARTRMAGV